MQSAYSVQGFIGMCHQYGTIVSPSTFKLLLHLLLLCLFLVGYFCSLRCGVPRRSALPYVFLYEISLIIHFRFFPIFSAFFNILHWKQGDSYAKFPAESNMQMVKSKTMPLLLPFLFLPDLINRGLACSSSIFNIRGDISPKINKIMFFEKEI